MCVFQLQIPPPLPAIAVRSADAQPEYLVFLDSDGPASRERRDSRERRRRDYSEEPGRSRIVGARDGADDEPGADNEEPGGGLHTVGGCGDR